MGHELAVGKNDQRLRTVLGLFLLAAPLRGSTDPAHVRKPQHAVLLPPRHGRQELQMPAGSTGSTGSIDAAVFELLQ